MKRVAVYILLVCVYGFTLLVAWLAGLIPRWRWKPTGRIIITGTFHNPNWYLSHITPLARSKLEEVILVVDEPQLPIEKVRFICPPRWMSLLFTRHGAKALYMIIMGIRFRPDLYMGYHLAPGACSALVAGKVLGRPSCYQMTGGPIEIIGGGVGASDSIAGSLGSPSKFIERLALSIARKFELIIVRGNNAKEFLAERKIEKSVVIITGSVNVLEKIDINNREIDLVFVGRISPIKQVSQFIEIVAALSKALPDVKAAIVGDGPLLSDMQEYAEKLNVRKNIEFAGKKKNVEEILAKSKIFILTSKSEGLSIAMAEAMIAGVVPVVANVGELSDLVIDGINGYLVEPNNINEYIDRVKSILQDSNLWNQYSDKAKEIAKRNCSLDVVTQKWQDEIDNIVSVSSGYSMKEVIN